MNTYKRILFWLCLSLVPALTFSQARKIVLFEHFTQASCGPCASQNPVFDTSILEKNIGNIAHIAYHTDWPGSDPMNAHNPGDVSARVTYYGVSGVPNMRMLGNKYAGGPAGITQQMVNQESSVSSPIRIRVTETPNGSGRDIQVIVYTVGVVPTGNLKLRTAVVESEINYASPPGSNGEKDFPNVFRKSIPSAAGDAYTPATTGDSVVFNYSYTYHAAWDTNKVYVIAWVQNDSGKEVINASTSWTPDWELVPSAPSFVEGIVGAASTFNADIHNLGDADQLFFLDFYTDHPSNWSANYTAGGVTSVDTITLVVPARSSVSVAFNVIPGASPAIGNYKFSIEPVVNPGYSPHFMAFNVVQGVTDLIVNNDAGWGDGGTTQSKDFESNYLNGLTDAGSTTFASTSLSVFEKGMEASALSAVEHIYYNVGWAFPSLTDANVAHFKDFLDNGGNMMICGQDIGWETWDQNGYGTALTKSFYTNYLKASFVNDGGSANNQLVPVASDNVYGNIGTSPIVNVYGSGSTGAYFYPDQINPVTGGDGIYTYGNNPTKFGGVKASNGTWKTVYLGIGIEMIQDTSVRKQIVHLTHDWFHGLVGQEDYQALMSELLGNPYPNPATNNLIVPFTDLKEKARIFVHDSEGKLVYSSEVKPGSSKHRINCNGWATGVYRISLSSGKTSKSLLVIP